MVQEKDKDEDKKRTGYSEWIPREYLEQYYSTNEIAEDEKAIYAFIENFLQEEKPQFTNMIEFGCGPTIHHLIPFVPFVKEITLADFREDNLTEIKNWISNSDHAHDWSMYIKGVLKRESDANIEKQVELMKSRIAEILQGDVFQKYPLGRERVFSLVTSFYCVDCATESKEKWRQLMKNAFSLVAPGGWLIMSALRNAKGYKVNDKYFPSANVSEEDVITSLRASNFVRNSIAVKVYPIAMLSEEGFDSIIVCKAKKEPNHENK